MTQKTFGVKKKKAYELIIKNAIEYTIEFASAKYVDEFNLKQSLHAT